MEAIPSTPFPTDTAPATLFVALELSRSTWLVAMHSPVVDKVSQHRLEGGDTRGLFELIMRKRTQAAEKLGRPVRVACCFEAGYDGLWLHRWLCAQGVENRVLDAASILVNRRARRAKTDRLDLAGLLRADGAGARRDAGLPRRARTEPGAGRREAAVAGAGPARGRARPAHEPHQGPADDAGHPRLRADPERPAGAPRGAAH